MSEALRLAELLTNLKITVKGRDNAEAMEEAAAELRRLHAEHTELGQALKRAIERINELEAELAEQARVNGMGGEREASLMAELERKSDAIQRLWKERDELRALNAELVKALKGVLEVWQDDPAYGHGAIDKAWELLVKVEASK